MVIGECRFYLKGVVVILFYFIVVMWECGFIVIRFCSVLREVKILYFMLNILI